MSIHWWDLLSTLWQQGFVKRKKIKLNSASYTATVNKDNLAGDTKQRKMQVAH